jgi:hypothetical protein
MTSRSYQSKLNQSRPPGHPHSMEFLQEDICIIRIDALEYTMGEDEIN